MDLEENEESDPRVAWCSNCDGPVDVDGDGQCMACRENGDDPRQVTDVVREQIPAASSRNIECPLCGTDIGAFCHPDGEGGGFNHYEREEEHDAEVREQAERTKQWWLR